MKTLLQLFLSLCLTNCNAQIPKTKKMQLTDKEIKEQGSQIKKEDTIFMKEGKLDIAKLESEGISSGSTKPFSYEYEVIMDNDIYINISGNKNTGYGKYIKFNKDDDFKYGYSYFSSGELNGYGIEYINFFKKGVWYDYDIQGNIEKYKDYDSSYDFSWENVLEFLKEKKISKKDIYQISRGIEDGEPKWYVEQTIERGLEPEKTNRYILDGKTGKILKTAIIDVTRHLD